MFEKLTKIAAKTPPSTVYSPERIQTSEGGKKASGVKKFFKGLWRVVGFWRDDTEYGVLRQA